MKKLTIVLTFFVFHFSIDHLSFSGGGTLSASTIIIGPTASGHWTLAGSPYLIQNSVYIPNDSTLIIDPGVTVNFQTAFTPYIHVLGRLLAIGTLTDSIYFTATDTTDGSHGIRFYDILSTNDTSKLEYCKIQYGKANGSNYYVENGGALLFDNWSKAIVSHCYISNCQANYYPNYGGGAIFCDSGSSPIITYNTITINQVTSTGGGGGIAIYNGSTPVIAYNTIIGNSADYGGAIMIGYVNNYALTNNTILYNSGVNGGGGIFMSSSKGTIANNTISYNSVPYGPGGGIYDANGDTLSILKDTISYNTAANGNSGYGGGGIVCQSTNGATVADNIISNNSAYGSNGGGIYLVQVVAVTISNNTIINNYAQDVSLTGYGGAIYCNNTSPLIINTTIANNLAYDGGGLYCDLSSNPVSRNSIYWGDTATDSGNELFQNDQPSTPDYYYCDVQGGQAAFGLNGNFYLGTYANTINSNPTFVSPSAGKGIAFDGVSANWKLQNGSQCIDAGDPLYSPYPATDLGGNPRIVICRVDMGAYENQYGISSPLQISISGSNSLCYGDSTMLAASGAATFSWSPSTGLSCTNCPNPTATPTATITYTVIGTSGVCEAMDTVRITVNPLPILTISNSLDTLKISGAKTYVWSTGGTSDTAIIHGDGIYYVTATDSNGCKSKDSISIITTAILNTANGALEVSVYLYHQREIYMWF